MEIVAILDVDPDKFFSDKTYSMGESINKFVEYYPRPAQSKQTVIVTKHNFYRTFGQDTHTFNWNDFLKYKE